MDKTIKHKNTDRSVLIKKAPESSPEIFKFIWTITASFFEQGYTYSWLLKELPKASTNNKLHKASKAFLTATLVN